MPSLPRDLRKKLETVTMNARDEAEKAARLALENLAVHEKEARGHMTPEQRGLRNRLRALGRARGDARDERAGTQSLGKLVEHTAYEHWHRMLFSRFLAENHLLMHDGVPLTLAECDALAPDMGAQDGFDLACRFAVPLLPGIFRADDPALEVRFAPEGLKEMRELLDQLPAEVFTADDSLGWTYQFWQARRKEQINKTDNKRGADEIPAVTQLFTEDYMVDFLLDNTLGAWWAGRKMTKAEGQMTKAGIQAASEADARAAVALPGCEWKYLRFIRQDDNASFPNSDLRTPNSDSSWSPAAGTFEGWPKSAREIKALDPCMGSGHFEVAMFTRLVALRVAEEGLSAPEAVVAALRDNLYGLEIDPRCTQIAAFNLALAAWKLGGYQPLPPLHLACSGLAPRARVEDWVRLAGDNLNLQYGMRQLHKTFEQAPVLGSLINPRTIPGAGHTFQFEDLAPLMDQAMRDERADETAHEMAVVAQGIAKAAEILAGQFTLVATNVPYLGRGKQDDVLMDFCERVYSEAKTDLATCFVERCLDFCDANGSTALVTPQNWLFLGSYRKLREKLLPAVRWDFVSRLGPKGFQTPMWDFNIMLTGLSRARADQSHEFAGLDVTQEASPELKTEALLKETVAMVGQLSQLKNPDCRVVQREGGTGADLLTERAEAFQGLITGDRNSFIYRFWEIPKLTSEWEVFVDGFSGAGVPLGRENIILWERGNGRLYRLAEVNRDRLHDMHESGNLSWGKKGVLLTRIGLRATPHYGERYDNNLICIIPRKPEDLPGLWNFCSSLEYRDAVRELDQKLSLTNATACKVGVDLDGWLNRGEFPAPITSDPTQWLFNGHPKDSDQPLQVAVARLLGHQWPRQTGSSFPDCPELGPDGLEPLADTDGIVCLSALNREFPAADRLRKLLHAAWAPAAPPSDRELLAQAGAKAITLEDWLRDEFFEQHCALFHHRPIIWHIWDGRKDGFHALVNYHRLDHATLQKLAFTYLGRWIQDQEEGVKTGTPGAELRLGAARELQTRLGHILEGEAPHDIFVRWKPLREQAIGWHPDPNDGIRLNIRPFAVADVLRKKVKIKWDKDRGKEPVRPLADYPWFWCEEDPGTDPTGGPAFTGNRWNDVHLSLHFKRRAGKQHQA